MRETQNLEMDLVCEPERDLGATRTIFVLSLDAQQEARGGVQ
jgi:hypothetical protein